MSRHLEQAISLMENSLGVIPSLPLARAFARALAKSKPEARVVAGGVWQFCRPLLPPPVQFDPCFLAPVRSNVTDSESGAS